MVCQVLSTNCEGKWRAVQYYSVDAPLFAVFTVLTLNTSDLRGNPQQQLSLQQQWNRGFDVPVPANKAASCTAETAAINI